MRLSLGAAARRLGLVDVRRLRGVRRVGSEQGQALVEWMVVAALAMMAAVWAAGEFAQKAEQAAVNGYAQWLQAVARAVSDALKQDDAQTHGAPGVLMQLPANTLSPVEPWLVRLKQGGWLSAALVATPKMPYNVSLVRLVGRGAPDSCDSGPCPITVLLLAVPRSDRQAPHVSAMLAALDGQGLAVTDLAPDRLQGATYQLPNSPTSPTSMGTTVGRGLTNDGLRLPVGTVGLLAWRADRAPPYVRLHETRPVMLAGGMQLGRLANVQGSCHPDGTMMVGPAGELRICRSGRWEEVSERHDHVRSCLPLPNRNHLAESLLQLSGLWSIFGRAPECNCPAGFGPFDLGTGSARVGPVELLNGRACLRL